MAALLRNSFQLARTTLLRSRAKIHEHFTALPTWRVADTSKRSLANDARRDGIDGSLSDSLRSALCNVWRVRDQNKKRSKRTPFARDFGDVDITNFDSLETQILQKLEFAERISKDPSLDALTEHLRTFGYSLRIRNSEVAGAGRGVFLAMGGFERGEVLSMYPGTVYTITRLLEIATLESVSNGIIGPPSGPRLPIFMHKNKHLLQEREVVLKDGSKARVDLLCDGNPYGQSALRFLKEIEDESADSSWLELETENPPRDRAHRLDVLLNDKGVGRDHTTELSQPLQYGMVGARSFLSLGHLFNHCPSHLAPHVRFVFVPLSPSAAPPELMRHLPNVNARPDRGTRWVIAAIALRPPQAPVEDPDAPVELYTHYGRHPQAPGWQVKDTN